MPEGTIQDSRDPNSPQWGYLHIDNNEDFLVHAEKVDKGNKDGLQDKGLPKNNPLGVEEKAAWNDTLLYVNNTDNPDTGRLVQGNKVRFYMSRKSIEVDGLKVGFWVARVTHRL